MISGGTVPVTADSLFKTVGPLGIASPTRRDNARAIAIRRATFRGCGLPGAGSRRRLSMTRGVIWNMSDQIAVSGFRTAAGINPDEFEGRPPPAAAAQQTGEEDPLFKLERLLEGLASPSPSTRNVPT